MRRPLVAGNWKMNKTVGEASELVNAMMPKLNEIKGVEKVLCPPFVSLPVISYLLKGSDIGANRRAEHVLGGEGQRSPARSAPAMVKELCGYVILGHSERRAYFGETDETVNKRLHAAQKIDLIPIVCVDGWLNNTNEISRIKSWRIKSVLASLTSIPSFAPRLWSRMSRSG